MKELDNVQVRDFRTAGDAMLRRHGSEELVPVAWRIYGETAQLRGKEYQIGGFRMDVEVPEQGSYAISTPSAVFDVERIAAHGDAPVEFIGPGMRVVGVGFDIFTDVETEGENARNLLFIIREAVQLELDRKALRRFGHDGSEPVLSEDSFITLSASRLTMQLTPGESAENAAGDRRGESGVVTLEGNVLLHIPPVENATTESSEHQWDGWELSGDRMLVFLSQPSRDETSERRVNWVERVEVSGHLRVETDGGRQRLVGERGAFTTADGHLTIDGNVLMMNQFKDDNRTLETDGAPRWDLFFTSRATICFASDEERQAQREQHHRESVISRVELPTPVTMIAADASHKVVATRGEFSGIEGCVSLLGEVRGELRNPSAPGTGDYLLSGPQVDFYLEDELRKDSGARIVFPQGMTLQQRSGSSRVKTGWAGVELLSATGRQVSIRCTNNFLAELHGQGGKDHELFLSGDQMVMQLDFGQTKTNSALDCIEWIDLPERVTVWGKAKGVSHRVGGDHGRYERATKTITLEENVILALAQGEVSDRGPEEVRIMARRATVRLAESPASQLTISNVDLTEDLVARTADFSVYVTAENAHYDYSVEELEMRGRVRAEVTPGNGQRDLRQAVTLDTTRVVAHSDLQQVVFPEPLTLSSHDQTIRLSGNDGLLDVANRRCALNGDTRIAFASRRAGAKAGTEVGLNTQRVLVYLAEREASRTGTGRSGMSIDRIDLPERLTIYTADGRQRLSGDHGSYAASTNAVAVDGNVEARFAGEVFDQFDAAGALGMPGQGTRRQTEEMVLNCEQLVARLRNEPLSISDAEEGDASSAFSMLESLEIPGKVSLQSMDGSRKVVGDRCAYRQEDDTITLDGNCKLEYMDERGYHAVTSPRVVFDCATRTIVTGNLPVEPTSPDDEPAKPTRTTITIPFASHPLDKREPVLPVRGLKR